jgi:hypothetical protein
MLPFKFRIANSVSGFVGSDQLPIDAFPIRVDRTNCISSW